MIVLPYKLLLCNISWWQKLNSFFLFCLFCFVFIFISCCNLKREEAILSILSSNCNNNKNRNKDISYLVFSHWLMQWEKRLWEKRKILKCRIQSNNSKVYVISFFFSFTQKSWASPHTIYFSISEKMMKMRLHFKF